MDDDLVTSSNTMVAKGIRAIPEIWTSFFGDGKLKYEYRSIVKTTYTIEHQLLGVNPNVRYFMGNKKMLL
ncbi:MAG TPA: hypothetical protein PKK00_12465 [Bacteroidales bacterium]|nr:hypothetical protein [Bacteroidales bacterium]HPS18042.1 hypothetical protein [Bacteroidales bacterium]